MLREPTFLSGGEVSEILFRKARQRLSVLFVDTGHFERKVHAL